MPILEKSQIADSTLTRLEEFIGNTMEKRCPGEDIRIQMLKSLDLMAGGMVIGAVTSTIIVPIEFVIDTINLGINTIQKAKKQLGVIEL